MEAANIAIYPVIMFVCALVFWGYGSTIIDQVRKRDFSAVFKMRLGIALGFFITGIHAGIWGLQRVVGFAGSPETAEAFNEFALAFAIVPRIALIVAGLLHMEAVWEMSGKSRWKPLSVLLLGVYVVLWLLLIAVEQ